MVPQMMVIYEDAYRSYTMKKTHSCKREVPLAAFIPKAQYLWQVEVGGFGKKNVRIASCPTEV